MDTSKEPVSLTLELIRETSGAYLVSDGSTEAWIPISQIEEEERNLLNNEIDLTIPEWLALDKGLI